MLRSLFSSACSLVRAGFVAALVFGYTAQAQTAPTLKVEPDHYYVNGKPATKAEVMALNTKTIKSVETFTGQQAADYAHDATAKKVVVVTTK